MHPETIDNKKHMSTENKHNDDEEEEEGGMTFWDHLEVLRWAIFRIGIYMVVSFVVVFVSMPYIFDQYILAPTSGDFFVYRWLDEISHGLLNFGGDFKVDIININVTSQFMTHISTSLYLAVVLAFPYIVFELWRFIRPALFDNELKNVKMAFMGGTLMFYLGCAVGYLLVFPFTFRFLTTYELSASIVNQINLSSYIDNFIMLIMVMRIVCEMPLVAWLLSCLGLINKAMLKKYRRHAVAILMVLAALITPSGDPFTMMLVFVPLYMLYELSIKVVKKRQSDDEDEEETSTALTTKD